MIIKPKILFILFICILQGCTSNNMTKLMIKNETNDSIQNILIFTTNSLNKNNNIGGLAKDNTIISNLVIDPKDVWDGAYCINAIKSNGDTLKRCFGYYSNGNSLNFGFKLILTVDSVIVKEW